MCVMSANSQPSGRKKICVITKDAYLLQKIKLELSDCEIVCEPTGDALIIADIDTATAPSGALRASRATPCDLPLPLRLGAIRELLAKREEGSALITLLPDDRGVMLRGRRIRLTEVEYALFALLYERMGDFVTREEILDKVWQGERDEGVINVYVHYLREKLECEGEKIILSSRKAGYAIDKKFVGGAKC